MLTSAFTNTHLSSHEVFMDYSISAAQETSHLAVCWEVCYFRDVNMGHKMLVNAFLTIVWRQTRMFISVSSLMILFCYSDNHSVRMVISSWGLLIYNNIKCFIKQYEIFSYKGFFFVCLLPHPSFTCTLSSSPSPSDPPSLHDTRNLLIQTHH